MKILFVLLSLFAVVFALVEWSIQRSSASSAPGSTEPPMGGSGTEGDPVDARDSRQT